MNPNDPFQPVQNNYPPLGTQPVVQPTPQNPTAAASLPNPMPAETPQTAAAPYAGPQPTTVAPPSHDPQSPYGFILNPEAKQPAANSGKNPLLKRILTALAGLVVLAIIAAVAMNLLVPKDNSGIQLTALAQEQYEIVRVSAVVVQQAKTTSVRDFATNAQLAVTTNEQATVKYINDRKLAVINDKVLAGKHDDKTDKALQAALTSNTFDTAAVQTLTTALGTYQTNLKKAYADIKGTKARAVIQASYTAVELLVAQGTNLTVTQ